MVEKIITKYQEVFILEYESLPCTKLTEYKITLRARDTRGKYQVNVNARPHSSLVTRKK